MVVNKCDVPGHIIPRYHFVAMRAELFHLLLSWPSPMSTVGILRKLVTAFGHLPQVMAFSMDIQQVLGWKLFCAE